MPAWYGTVGLGIAVAGGLVVPGRPAGFGLSLLLLAALAVAAAVSPRDRWTTVWWALACVLALTPFLRTAGWVVALGVLGALGLGMAAAGRARTWARLFSAPAGFFAGLLPGPFVLMTGAGQRASGAVVRGVVAAGLLVALFGSLLIAADAAFADVAGSLVPPLDSKNTATGVLVAAAVGAFAWLAALPEAEPQAPPAPRVGSTETRIALGALAGLFAVFVGVQRPRCSAGTRSSAAPPTSPTRSTRARGSGCCSSWPRSRWRSWRQRSASRGPTAGCSAPSRC